MRAKTLMALAVVAAVPAAAGSQQPARVE